MLDNVAPIDADPFRDFFIAQPRSILIEPGEQTQIEVRFKPSRAARQQQKFQLIADAGQVGAEGDFTVEGDAIESPGWTSEDRIQDQDRQAALVDSARHVDPLRAQRAPAAKAVRDWARSAEKRNQLAADWSRDNWEEFVGRTGGDYTLYRTDKLMQYVKYGLSKGIEQSAGVENFALKLVAKKAIEILVDFFADNFGGEKQPSTDARLAETADGVASASVAKGGEINAYRDRANHIIEDAASVAELRIQQTETAADLDQWHTWAAQESTALPVAKDPADRSLRDQLLQEWVLQRAATPTAANKDTNPAAWKNAKTELKAAGELVTLRRPDLFIHQCRYEWNLLGLAGVDEALSKLDERRRRLDRDATSWGNRPDAIARLVTALMGSADQEASWFTRSTNPVQTANTFNGPYGDYGVAMGCPTTLADTFLLRCTLMLASDGDGVYVKGFHYFRTDNGEQHDLVRTPL
ncbi:MAG: hypothetical protein JWO36_1765 [Myxococcales bacterium]|nr:hypothetical protein [Myxococcales bacterium]